MTAGELLRAMLAAAGQSQADLSRRTATSTKHVNLVANSKARCSPAFAVRAEYALGVPGLALQLLLAQAQTDLAEARAARVHDDREVPQ